MKTAILTIVSFLILGFSGMSVANPKVSTGDDLDKVIKKQIAYPEFARAQKLEGVVLVDFTLNADGTIKVNATNQSDVNLKEYVVSKLEQIKVNPDSAEGKTYCVKFVFEYIK